MGARPRLRRGIRGDAVSGYEDGDEAGTRQHCGEAQTCASCTWLRRDGAIDGYLASDDEEDRDADADVVTKIDAAIGELLEVGFRVVEWSTSRVQKVGDDSQDSANDGRS